MTYAGSNGHITFDLEKLGKNQMRTFVKTGHNFVNTGPRKQTYASNNIDFT